jgi:hypothetical protein
MTKGALHVLFTFPRNYILKLIGYLIFQNSVNIIY